MRVRRRQSFTAFLIALIVGFTVLAVAAVRTSQEAVPGRNRRPATPSATASQLLPPG